MKFFIRIFSIALVGCFTSAAAFSQGSVPDDLEFQALKALYDSLAGSGWTTKTSWPAAGSWPASATATQMDEWYGVVVTNGDITELNFPTNNMTGKMPQAIGNLTALTRLYFHNNKINSTLPAQLNNLVNLTYLDMGYNLITGSLPNLPALTKLKTLIFRNNTNLAAAPIPSWVTSLTTLTHVNFSISKRNGSIPSNIDNLTELTFLDLNGNSLTGSIPSSVGSCTKLITLTLANNYLSGSIPESITSLTNLAYLYLQYNQLTGSLPSTLGQLNKLNACHIYNNQLSGEIPASINNLKQLTDLNLNYNNFTGILPDMSGMVNLTSLQLAKLPNLTPAPIPSWIGSLNKLVVLDLSDSKRNGSIPSTMGLLTNLANLYLQTNQLSGSLPENFGSCTKLVYLYLYTNNLSGELPASLGNLIKLQYLRLSSNSFSGSIPASFASLTDLRLLYLDYNQFSGKFPSFVGSWTKLTSINIRDNKFEGAFPTTIGSCPLLTFLRADNNKFISLPTALLTIPTIQLYFDYNELTAIPNFATHVSKSGLQLWLRNNYLDFSLIQPLISVGIAGLNYSPQNKIKDVVKMHVPSGQDLVIPSRPMTANTTITWEKQTGPTTWTNVTTQSENPTKQTFLVRTPTSAVNGTYRWKMTNSLTGTMTLESEPIAVEVVDALAANQSIEPSYGGLITAMRWRTDAAFGTGQDEFKGMYTFKYDYKYQLKESNWANADSLLESSNKYRVAGLNYDPNGNILSLRRYDKDGFKTNDFTYSYAPNKNQLTAVTGYVTNFMYNKIGQMIGEDKVEANADQYVDHDVTGKVVFVYADAAKSQKKVEYLYDDTGFRLAKVNFETQRTTWYIRDASGNIQSVYEQEGVATASNTNPIVQTEVPVYGAGKLATYYPQQDGSTAYEITDHLGNVRALVRDNIAIYTATMEDSGEPDISNPAVQEVNYFNNITATVHEDFRMNHTSNTATVVSTPDRSAFLFWQSGMTGMEAKDKSVGPAIMLKVNAGDKLDLETWARYERKANYARNMDLAVLSQFLGSSFAYQGAFEGSSIAQTVSTFQSAMQGAGFMTDGGDDTRPFAYLNYITFDKNFNRLNSGWQRVPDNAGFYPGEEGLPDRHVKLNFTQPVAVTQDGFIYVWVSNESEATKVFFDDLKITHQGSYVSQAEDFDAWGLSLRLQKSNMFEKYMFGYQGQFSERDLETGWNHFELRQFDPLIGRWTSTDPAGQYWSPYVGMGNNPVNSVDPDGAYSKFGAWWRSGFGARGDIYQSGMSEDGSREVWGFNTADGESHFGKDARSGLRGLISGSDDGHLGGIPMSFPDDGPYITNLPSSRPNQNGSSGLSTAFLAETAFTGMVEGGKKGLSIVNKQLARQNLINNKLLKSINSRTAFSPLAAPKTLKFVGKYGGPAFSTYSVIDTWNQYKAHRAHRMGFRRMVVEQTSNVIGAIPYYNIGTAWSIGWNLGGSYGPSKWYGSNDSKWFE